MKIFTEDILDVLGKDYPTPKKTDWNRIFERAVLELGIFATGYFIIHIVIFALGYYN